MILHSFLVLAATKTTVFFTVRVKYISRFSTLLKFLACCTIGSCDSSIVTVPSAYLKLDIGVLYSAFLIPFSVNATNKYADTMQTCLTPQCLHLSQFQILLNYSPFHLIIALWFTQRGCGSATNYLGKPICGKVSKSWPWHSAQTLWIVGEHGKGFLIHGYYFLYEYLQTDKHVSYMSLPFLYAACSSGCSCSSFCFRR